MFTKKRLRVLLRFVLPAIALLIGLLFIFYTHDATVVLVHLRRPGTTKMVAHVAAYHHEGDTYLTGWVCLASAFGWWLLPWKM